MADMIYFDLPFPPSVNGLFRNAARHETSRKRKPTKRYQAWIWSADRSPQGPWCQVKGPVHLKIILGAPDKRRRDCTNYIKAIEDWLVRCELIEGDDSRFVKKVTVCWADIEPGARVEIWPAT